MKDTDRLGNARTEKVEPHGDFQPSTEVALASKLRKADVQPLSRSEAQEKMFEGAKAHLRQMTPASIIQFLTEQPITLLEVYLLAEEAVENRPDILRQFPKPGALARQRYLPTDESPAPVSA